MAKTERVKEFTINLKEGLNYPKGGSVESGMAIKIFSPVSKQSEFVTVIDCYFHKAMIASSKAFIDMKDVMSAKSEEDKPEISGKEIMTILKSFLEPEKLTICHNAIRQILSSGKQCEVDGTKIGIHTLETELSITDLNIILGEYIANFIAASLLD